MTEDPVPKPPPRRLHPASVLIPLFGVGVCLLVFLYRKELEPMLLEARNWTMAQGTWGIVVFGAVYAIAIVLLIPGNIMTSVATALFGPLITVIVVSTAGTVGAVVCFLLARYGLRGFVAEKLAHNLRFRWLDEHTAKRGSLFVAVARILPIMPGNLLHYAFGITQVPLGVYTFWSWLGSLPGLILFATGLDTVLRFWTDQKISWDRIGLLALILLVKGLLIAWAARQAGVGWRRGKPDITV